MLCSLPWHPHPLPPSSLLYLAAAFSFISLSLSPAMQLRGNILKISASTDGEVGSVEGRLVVERGVRAGTGFSGQYANAQVDRQQPSVKAY